jgi:serine/threonine-protein kinase
VESQKPSVRIVGRYALYGTIAAGGMATVHFGRLLGPVGFSRTVAIKRLHPQFASDPEFVSMFLDEARLAARIRHPHVVPTLDVVAANGELFLVMDYVPGESLSRLIRASRERGERIPVQITIAVMSGVLQGLHAAHEARNERGEPLGIVHRDVSPQNVLVGSDGQARVLDFGVAKAAGRIQTTREGQLKGKLAYMAPEQLRSEPLTRKTDIYAASVVLWEALTCERLFGGDNEGAVVTKVLQGEIPAPSTRLIDLTKTLDSSVMRGFERLDAVVMRGLDRDASKRCDSAREMALALEKCFTPATAAEVSDWVERIASPILMARAGQIAEIESGSSSMPRSGQVEGALKGDAAGAWHPELGALGGEARTETAISSSNVQPSQLSSISVASNAALPLSSPSGLRIAVAALALVGVVAAAFAGYALLHSTPAASGVLAESASAPPVNGSGVSPGSPPPEASVVPPPASAAPLAAGSSSPQPTPQPRAGGTPPVAAPRPRAQKTPGSDTAAHPVAPPAPAEGCNPPYTWDSEGRKHYKPNCL